MGEKLSIRDFVYLDIERLKSVLSQIDEGLPESTTKTSGASGSAQMGAEASVPLLARFGGTGAYVASSAVAETKTLHDHIYNYVERKLLDAGSLFVLNNELGVREWLDDDVRDEISRTAFVLVRGKPLVNDFAYVKSFLGDFNEIAAAIARLSVSNKVKGLPESQRKMAIAEAVSNMQLPKGQQEDLRKVLAAFLRNDLLVRILPFDGNVEARVVTNLDVPTALRMPLESLIFRFGSAPSDEWTLFGQIASVPLSTDEPFKFTAALGAELDKVMQSTLNVLRTLEPLVASAVYPEICVVPIALYRG